MNEADLGSHSGWERGSLGVSEQTSVLRLKLFDRAVSLARRKCNIVLEAWTGTYMFELRSVRYAYILKRYG